MKLTLASLLALVILLVGALPTFAWSDTDLLAHVNAARAQSGVAPLAWDARLNTAAQGYARYMGTTNCFSHTCNGYFVDRIVAAGFPFVGTVGENLAGGQTYPWQVVADWLQSPSHKAIMLNPAYHRAGQGIHYQAGTQYGKYWVMEFGS